MATIESDRDEAAQNTEDFILEAQRRSDEAAGTNDPLLSLFLTRMAQLNASFAEVRASQEIALELRVLGDQLKEIYAALSAAPGAS